MNWNKAIGWLGVICIVALAAMLVAAAIVVRTASFRRFVVNEIERKAQEATGARLEIGSLVIHWGALHIDFYNVKLRGNESSAQRPLLTADHVGVGLKIVSLLRRDVNLSQIVLDRPICDLRVDAHGNSNLPVSPSQNKSASRSNAIFAMAIGDTEIHSGVIYYDDEEIPLSAELHDLQTQASFSRLTDEYRVSMGYDQGRLALKNYATISHAAQFRFTASPSGIVVQQAEIVTGGSRLRAQVSLTNYRNPVIQGTYQGSIVMNDLTRVIGTASNVSAFPAGLVMLDGAVRYRSADTRTFVNAVSVDGNLNSSTLLLRLGGGSTEAKAIRASYRLENGTLQVQKIAADVLDGHLTGDFQMVDIGGKPASTVDASVAELSLGGATRVFLPGAVRLAFTGRADVQAHATWTNNIDDIVARVTASISSPALAPAAGPAITAATTTAIPVNGKIDVVYDSARDSALFSQSVLRISSADISVTGLLSDRSNLNVAVRVSDLQSFDALAESIQTTGRNSSNATKSKLDALGLTGSAHFEGQVTGSVKNPRITGQLAADNFEIAGSRWTSLRTHVDAASSSIAVRDATLESARQGRITLQATAALHDWSLTPASAITAQTNVARMSIADLEHLGGFRYPITGNLTADISLSGSEQNPAGHGSLTVTQAMAWNEPISSLAIQFQGDGNTIHSTTQLHAPAGNLSATVGYSPKTQQYDASLNASGVDLSKIQAIQERNPGVAGKMSLAASGRGTVKDPQASGNLELSDLQIRERTIPRIQAQLGLAHEHATFAVHSDLPPEVAPAGTQAPPAGSVQAQGDIALTGAYVTTASVDVQALPMGLLLATYLPNGGPDFGGQTDVHATLRGPLKDPEQLEAHVEIPKLSVGYKSAQITNTGPLRIDYQNAALTVQPLEMKGSGTDFTVKGTIPIRSAGPVNASVKGTLDLAALKGLTPDLESSGRVDIDFAAAGTLAHPAMQGQARIANAVFSSSTIPVGFDALNAVLTTRGDRLEISQFSASAGGGQVTAAGFLTYGAQSGFNLNLDAKNVRVRYPQGVRSVIGGNIAVAGTSAGSSLTGRVLVDRLSFNRDFDMASLVGQLAGETPPAAASSFEQHMKLNVSIQSAQDLNAESSQLSIEGSANLNLGGTLANPVVLGRTTLSGGDIFFLGKRYEVQSGTIEFANPVQTQPILNVFMNTTVEQYDITLNFVGPLDRLRTNYTSTPALPPADIINLIAFGKTAEESAANSSTPAALGAESVLAQGVSGQVSGRIEKLAGISQLTIDPLASTTSDPGSQVSIQQQVTGNLLLTFSTDVTSTQNSAVQLKYQANRNLSISALRDQYGGYALDIRIRKTF